MSRYSLKNIVQLQVITLLLSSVVSAVFEHNDINDPNCEGSLVIVDSKNNEHSFTGKEGVLNIEVSSARVDGCGCFTVSKGRNGRGASKQIQSGNKFYQKAIGFKKIRSITPGCQVKGQPSWLVITIVVAVVLIVLVLALVGIKCYRARFNRLPQEDPET